MKRTNKITIFTFVLLLMSIILIFVFLVIVAHDQKIDSKTISNNKTQKPEYLTYSYYNVTTGEVKTQKTNITIYTK